jgi:hypothetical protein
VPQKGRTFRCRLRWRTGEAVGAEFLSSRSSGAAGAGSNAAPAPDDRLRELENENEELRRQVRDLTDRLAAREANRGEAAA